MKLGPVVLVCSLLFLWTTVSAQEQTNGSKTKPFANARAAATVESIATNLVERKFEERAIGCNGASDACRAVTEGYDDISTLAAKGWVIENLSNPVGVQTYFQGSPVSGGGPFDAFSGAADSYIAVNSFSGSGATATISNWLISPNQLLQNGDVVTFYTRTVDNPQFPDRLQVRLSGNGASTNVGTTETSVGDFTTLLLDINPTLTVSGYPNVWTQFSSTLSGLPASGVSGRLAFRYFVTNGGPLGINSDYIGIDSFTYTPINSNSVCSGGLCVCGAGAPITCDDADACNGIETCNVATGCAAGTPLVCDDSEPCTDDTCVAATGCVYTPDNTNSCSDTNVCNGLETCQSGNCMGGTPLLCGMSGCVAPSGCVNVAPQVTSASTVSPSPLSVLLPVSVKFTLSDGNGDSSSIVIDWGDGSVENFAGPYVPGTYTLGSHKYASTGTYCVKLCADDGMGTTSCDGAFLAALACSKKRAPGGSAFSIVVTRFSAGGDPYYLGYDGKMFEFHGNPGEVYNLISSVTSVDSIWLNVQFGNGVASNHIHSMGVVMRSIGLIVNQLRILFSVDEQGNVSFNLNGNEIAGFRNETEVDGAKVVFEPNVNFTRTALHMSDHIVHHQLLVKTPEMVIRMFGVKYQPESWRDIPQASSFHFVDLEANIIDPTFCPDGVWGSTACGGHHDPKIDYRYRIHGDDLLGKQFSS